MQRPVRARVPGPMGRCAIWSEGTRMQVTERVVIYGLLVIILLSLAAQMASAHALWGGLCQVTVMC